MSAAAIAHDVFRPQQILTGESHVGQAALERIEGLLVEAGLSREQLAPVTYCIRVHEEYPFWGGGAPETLEAAILQDADRLDALGAIGIGRTFMFNGRTGGAMWVPPEHRRPGPDDGAANTAIGHFRDKLLKLRDAMNTATARGLAAERHEFMELYLQRFYDEWYLS